MLVVMEVLPSLNLFPVLLKVNYYLKSCRYYKDDFGEVWIIWYDKQWEENGAESLCDKSFIEESPGC